MQLRAGPVAVPSGAFLFAYDLLATATSIVASLMLRFETIDAAAAVTPYLPAALLPLLVRPIVRLSFGLYRREWRFASASDLLDIAAAVAVGSLIILALFAIAAALSVPGTAPFPRSFFIIEPLLTLALVGGARFVIRIRVERAVSRDARRRFTRTLVYGAGEAGAAVARQTARDEHLGMQVVGFLDDDPSKRGSRLLGHRVHGGLADLASTIERTGARQMVVAMPSRAGKVLHDAMAAGERFGLDVKIIPAMPDLLTGEIRLDRPRQISVEDLLRRPPVRLDVEALAGYLNGASVVVTGGGGSIGGELVRQIVSLGPRVLTVIDYQEAALWNAERDAETLIKSSGIRLNPILADVRSRTSMQAVLTRARPDVVFHAAALKHVPYVEMHPSEGVLTNAVGTRNVLLASEAAGVPRFVLISTDKAVEPSSIMGWTKRLAELLVIDFGRRLGRPYSAVRFGNVLGSSGSLVPLLERQLEDGLPLTITEPDASRYFMTLSEAVTLILEAGSADRPGQVYVLDMGQPVRIGDLVDEFVQLKGADPATVEYRVTGLRPGEKLHEKLFFDEEGQEVTDSPGILRAVNGQHHDLAGVNELITALRELALERNDEAVRRYVHEVVAATAGAPGVTPAR